MTCVQDQQFNNVLCALTLRARPPCVILTPESSKRSIKIVGLDVFISLCCLYVSVCIEVLVLSVMSCLLSGVHVANFCLLNSMPKVNLRSEHLIWSTALYGVPIYSTAQVRELLEPTNSTHSCSRERVKWLSFDV